LIENATFNLNGNIYNVSKNAKPHNLHGGTQGFNVKVWDAALDASNPSAASLILTRKSPHMEEGFPGEVDVKVTYTLDDSNALTINYQAISNEDTPLTLTNHAYFNLSGFKKDIQEHFISVGASNKMEMDESCIVNGTQIALEGSIEDLRKGQHIKTVHDAINDGFEHYYVFDKQLTESPQKVVEIKSELGQRAMEVHTTEPGMLFYTGKYTSNDLKREDGLQYGKFRGLCFETQRFPNGPNIKGYEDAILRKGETFKSTTIFRFKW
jgi:aldose 1-epimerase